MEEIDFKSDSFEDIVRKDKRYNARAYALLMNVIHFLSKDGKHMSGEEILDEFKESALDQYGPLTYRVLNEWGVNCCEDIGEMMFNLVDGKRIMRDENDSMTSFSSGYDFREAFLEPYQA